MITEIVEIVREKRMQKHPAQALLCSNMQGILQLDLSCTCEVLTLESTY